MNYHNKGLLAHFNAMQSMCGDYVEPTPTYHSKFSDSSAVVEGETETPEQRNEAFANDMIYMLDGPEQRQAQAAAEFDYVAEAHRTIPAGGQFNGDMVSLKHLKKVLGNFMEAAEALDEVKKALFYRRGKPIDIRLGEEHSLAAIYSMITPEERVPEIIDQRINILHGIIGLATESGELVEMLYRTIFQGKPLDLVNIKEEVGDGKWYMAVLAKAAGFEWGEDEAVNIDKLRKRFPDKFANDLAINRDHAAERVILEGNHEIGAGRELMDSSELRDNLGLPLEGTVSTPRHHVGKSVETVTCHQCGMQHQADRSCPDCNE